MVHPTNAQALTMLGSSPGFRMHHLLARPCWKEARVLNQPTTSTALAVTAGPSPVLESPIVVHRHEPSPRGPLAHPGEGSPSSSLSPSRSRRSRVHAVKVKTGSCLKYKNAAPSLVLLFTDTPKASALQPGEPMATPVFYL